MTYYYKQFNSVNTWVASLLILVSLPFILSAGNNHLWFNHGSGNSGSDDNEISIELSNEDLLSGIEMTLHYPADLISLDTIAISDSLAYMDLQYNEHTSGIVEILIFSMAGDTIFWHTQPLLTLQFAIPGSSQAQICDLTLQNVFFADYQGNSIRGDQVNGDFIINGHNYIQIEDGNDPVNIILSNNDYVSGIQLFISYDQNLLAVDSLVKTDFLGDFELSYNTVNPGELIALIYNYNGVSINPGNFPLLQIFFRGYSAISNTTNITFEQVVLADTNGTTIEATGINGLYYFISPTLDLVDLEYQQENGFHLAQNYPNPFNPVTTIRYELPQRLDVKITIYDLGGNEVATLVSETQEAGHKSVHWNASNQPSGVYLCRLMVGDQVETRKMVLLK